MNIYCVMKWGSKALAWGYNGRSMKIYCVMKWGSKAFAWGYNGRSMKIYCVRKWGSKAFAWGYNGRSINMTTRLCLLADFSILAGIPTLLALQVVLTPKLASEMPENY